MPESKPFHVVPGDAHDNVLIANAHPPSWVNPEPASSYNLVVIGAGTAGLVAAAGGAAVGARVALIEKALMGGDCLNYGCVPSKAVIRSSRTAAEIRNAADFGIVAGGPVDIDFAKVMERMRRLRAQISGHDSAERFKGLGVDVFLGEARFFDKRRIEVGGKFLKFAKALIATGAKPIHPPIPGLAEAGFLTNETVFTLTRRPESLAVIGGGPIGCELAQAFRRLGSKVTIIQRDVQFLPREDRDAAELLGCVFAEEDIVCKLNARITQVTVLNGKKRIHFTVDGREEMIEAEEILVGAGRAPNVEGLNLEAAGVDFDARSGVKVNGYLQTTNRRIYAAGDVAFPFKFTHIAEATARIVVQNALFLKSKKTKSLTIPWCTYTDPEIAHVGMSEKEAQAAGIKVRTFVRPFKDVDRAVLDGEDNGFVKIHVKKEKDRIVGATIVGRHAGEMISEITAVMAAGKGVKLLAASVIHPYPTQADAVKQASGQYYAGLMKPFLKKALGKWFSWKR
ncbi:MAG: mercuric reductase [Acidobacteriota bacterium]|nr:mercuric reductase [Acidobacteriota bacterium]